MSSPDSLYGKLRPPINTTPDTTSVDRELIKDEITVLPIWFGQRFLDGSDFSRFEQIFWSHGRSLKRHPSIEIPEAAEIHDPIQLAQVIEDVEKFQSKDSLAIFPILTAKVAELTWYEQFSQKLVESCRKANQNTFTYKIILGGGFSNLGIDDPQSRFWPEELKAHELGGVYLKYSSDSPTPGSERLVEFMNRIMGMDLGLAHYRFPNYTPDEVRKIAWHINRESFNAVPGPKSLPKYENGLDGRPIFPF